MKADLRIKHWKCGQLAAEMQRLCGFWKSGSDLSSEPILSQVHTFKQFADNAFATPFSSSSSPSSPSPLLWSNVLSVSNQWQLSLNNFPFQQLHELCVCSFYLGFASCLLLLDDLTRQMIEYDEDILLLKFQDNDWKALWLNDLNNDCGFPSLYFG